MTCSEVDLLMIDLLKDSQELDGLGKYGASTMYIKGARRFPWTRSLVLVLRALSV